MENIYFFNMLRQGHDSKCNLKNVVHESDNSVICTGICTSPWTCLGCVGSVPLWPALTTMGYGTIHVFEVQPGAFWVPSFLDKGVNVGVPQEVVCQAHIFPSTLSSEMVLNWSIFSESSFFGSHTLVVTGCSDRSLWRTSPCDSQGHIVSDVTWDHWLFCVNNQTPADGVRYGLQDLWLKKMNSTSLHWAKHFSLLFHALIYKLFWLRWADTAMPGPHWLH